MRRLFVIVCTFCMLICGCSSHPVNNDKDRLVLDFDGTHSMIVGTINDRVISPTEDVELVNSVIEKYKDYKFKRIENRNDNDNFVFFIIFFLICYSPIFFFHNHLL